MIEPQAGDIGCTNIPGDVGLLIRAGEALNGDGFSRFSHAFICIGDGQIVEAEPGGARIADLAEYDPRTVVYLRCPDEKRQTVADAAQALVGTPYSSLDYFALALHRFRIPAPWLRRYINSTRHEICSQLCVTAAQRGGWNLLPRTQWPGYVTPADLAKLAEPLA